MDARRTDLDRYISIEFAEGRIQSADIASNALQASLAYRFMHELVNGHRRLGYYPNLIEPKTFNEKIMARKLFAPRPIYSRVADKLAVRDHVRNAIGEAYLVPLFAVIEDSASFDPDPLPDAFVLRTAHASGEVLLVKKKDNFTLKYYRDFLKRNIERRFGLKSNESWYLNIPPRVLAQDMLVHHDFDSVVDFRLHVFHGEVRMIIANAGLPGRRKKAIYDESWTRLELEYGRTKCNHEFARPENLDEMISIAKALAAGFSFIRIDLLSTGKRLYFGEITIAPNAGWRNFTPESADEHYGAFWDFSADLECSMRERAREAQETMA